MSQLSEDEGKKLDEASVRLEGELGRLKAFEIKFPGKNARERFAAKSVKERAGWISAIWDAILPDHEPQRKVYDSLDQESASTPGSSVAPLAKNPSIQSPIPRAIPEMSVLLNPSFSQRSLPPVPPETVPPTSPQAPNVPLKESRKPNLHLDIPPPVLSTAFSPSLYPPTSAASTPTGGSPLETPSRTSATTTAFPPFLASNNHSSSTPCASLSASTYAATSHHPSLFGASSPPASPSIINLGQLSMVRQRLAQIERNHSEISARSSGGYSATVSRPGTPMTPTKSRRAMSPLGSPTSIRTVPALPSPRAFSTRASTTSHLPVTRRKSSRRPTQKKPEEVPANERETVTQTCDDVPDSQSGISPQVGSQDMDAISKRVVEIKNVLGGESGYPTIHQVVLGIESRLHKDSKSLKTVKEKIEQLGGQVSTAFAAGQSLRESFGPSGNSDEDAQAQKSVQKTVEDVKLMLDKEFPSISNRLKDIQAAQAKSSENQSKITELRNIGASKTGGGDTEVFDVRPILESLQELKDLAQRKDGISAGKILDPTVMEQLEKIQSRLQEDSNKQALVSQQQADSVRYLNELNNWLETFVNNGTAQIQGLSMNVYQLCKSLGCIPQQTEPGEFGQVNDEFSPNLLSDIRQLVEGMQARDQNFAALQTAVHSLLEVLSASQQQMGAESQAIAGLITRQRQEQEALLRSFTNEISGEIRGERLRFVEAMKEATAINVQLHVENFKQELGREVMAMTEEVGRLHREKQQVENQISDLFAFYSKHKQDNPLRPIEVNTEVAVPRQQVQERPRANLPRASHHRPLPYPRR
ncbi:hypothetical protein CPB83DRAFT_273503 [Crepidotus variabilis]|uniref:PH domain-containing protein n=1 Tax=Crepidotus variabilis TaxID=179855 RepID=A0A9P6JQV8_9AGAR|nr:hypothetical protein CPB83DRAFT_273503 [Crepidotus variabilis]